MRAITFVMAVGAALMATALLGGTGRVPAELGDQELATLWGGRAPSTYCNPVSNCSGTVIYCSDATPGANAGDPCSPSSVTTYYNPEHCTEQVSPRQCFSPSSVLVYCLTVSNCVTAFAGTQKICIVQGSSSQGQTITTDMSRCRNLALFDPIPPPSE